VISDSDHIQIPTIVNTVEPATVLETTSIHPIVTHNFHRFTSDKDPIVPVILNEKHTKLLIDSGAHISVIPKSTMSQLVDIQHQDITHKDVSAFGGQKVTLHGPVKLTVNICGVTVEHPFYYAEGHIPSVAGFDLMKAAKLVLDPNSKMVWSYCAGINDTAQ